MVDARGRSGVTLCQRLAAVGFWALVSAGWMVDGALAAAFTPWGLRAPSCRSGHSGGRVAIEEG